MPDVAEGNIADILAREVLNRGLSIHVKAVGPSMHPFITGGDRVLVEPGPAVELKIGDVVVYQDGGRYIMHRLVKKTGPGTIVTRGDNMPGNDPPVPVENIMGRVTRIESRGRRMLLTGKLSHMFSRVIAWFAPSRIRGKRIVVRSLGRLCWLVEGRRIT